jgi:hypothetical protein
MISTVITGLPPGWFAKKTKTTNTSARLKKISPTEIRQAFPRDRGASGVEIAILPSNSSLPGLGLTF